MTTDEMRALGEQCISHPASRTTGDIERAGMAIIELQARVKALEEAQTLESLQKDQQKALQELAADAQLVYSAWRR